MLFRSGFLKICLNLKDKDDMFALAIRDLEWQDHNKIKSI